MMSLNIAKNLGNEYNIHIIEVLVALLVLMISVFLFILWKRNHTAKNVLLTGLQDSGKTSIFYYLLHKLRRLDSKSRTDDLGVLRIKNKLIHLIDIPVQEKVFSEYWDIYKKCCKGIIFVVNSRTLQADLCDVAKLLYCILTDKIIQSKKTKILILSKKRFDDNPNASSEITKKLLEKELDTFMLSNSNHLECMYGKKNKTVLGNQKKQFEFVDCQIPIEFAEVISSHQKVFLDQIIDWLEKI